jgi:hypothetical protein
MCAAYDILIRAFAHLLAYLHRLTEHPKAEDVKSVPLKDVERAWKRTDVQGRRIVIMP